MSRGNILRDHALAWIVKTIAALYAGIGTYFVFYQLDHNMPTQALKALMALTAALLIDAFMLLILYSLESDDDPREQLPVAAGAVILLVSIFVIGYADNRLAGVVTRTPLGVLVFLALYMWWNRYRIQYLSIEFQRERAEKQHALDEFKDRKEMQKVRREMALKLRKEAIEGGLVPFMEKKYLRAEATLMNLELNGEEKPEQLDQGIYETTTGGYGFEFNGERFEVTSQGKAYTTVQGAKAARKRKENRRKNGTVHS
jgi:hypothetical protein